MTRLTVKQKAHIVEMFRGGLARHDIADLVQRRVSLIEAVIREVMQ